MKPFKHNLVLISLCLLVNLTAQVNPNLLQVNIPVPDTMQLRNKLDKQSFGTKSYADSLNKTFTLKRPENIVVRPAKPGESLSKKLTNLKLEKPGLPAAINPADSLKNKLSNLKKKSKLSVTGVISNQYDYGAIPYYMANNSLPAGLYKSTGSLKLRLNKLPLIVDYFYASPKLISGLNNYFNVKLDVNELQEMTNNEYLKKAAAMRKKIDSLSIQTQKLDQQLKQIELAKSNKINLPTNPKLPVKPNLNLNNTLNLDDSLSGGISFSKLPGDSLNGAFPGIDTSSAKVAELRNKLQNLQKLSEQLRQNADLIEYPNPSKNPRKVFSEPGLLKMLGGFKKLEVGMCYPGYSTFMVNQVAIKGLNTSYSLGKVFTNFTIGKTVVNYSVQPTNNPILSQIQNINSVFNWNNNPNEKKIVSGKLGFGNENKSYIAIGALYGKGTISPNTTEIKMNYVFELDGRYTYKFLNFEGAVAKTILTEQSSGPLQNEISAPAQAGTFNRSFQGRFFGTLPKLKTKFSQLYRLVEPNFKSFGLGFMRSDIQRIETKLEQPIGSKVKLGINYRRDEDNLKGLQYYKTILENISYSAKIKLLKKRMDINLSYTDVIQNIRDYNTAERKRIASTIKTVVITYTPKFRRLNSTNTILVNQFSLKDLSKSSNIWNYSFNSINQYKKWLFNSLNTFNQSTIKDSLNFSNALNNSMEITYMVSDKFKVSGGGKRSYSFKTKLPDYGYMLGISWALHKLINLELRAEKLVLGDYINTLNYKGIKDCPYYGYLKITTKF